MPNRLIREGLMESEKVLSLPVEARWLFVIVILSADDVGLFEATEFKLARRADINRELAGKLLQMIGDADLVRFYIVDGKRYGFIPKFRQRIQIKRTKHPMPPKALMADDSDALSKIKNLASDPTDGQPLDNGCQAGGQPPEAEPEAKEEISDASHPRRQRKAADRMPTCPYEDIVRTYHEVLPGLPGVRIMDPARKKAIKALWTFVMTSTKSDGSRRAITPDQGLTWVRTYFTRVLDNDWLMGRTTPRPGHETWRCTLDFLCSSKGLKAVIERTEVTA
jgi:hypothetical protein